MNPGLYAELKSRSSYVLKNISVEAGVIDSDYRGLVDVCLRNHNDTDYRSACPKICYKSSLKNFQNIDKWAPDDSGVVLDYLKLYAVFNSVIR